MPATALLIFLFLILAPFSADARSASEPTPSTKKGAAASVEKRVHERINAVRREHGRPPLVLNPDLTEIARDHSRQMSRERFFSHADPQGRQIDARLRDAGIPYRLVGENIFKSQNVSDPVDAAVKGWMDSPGHRENILREGFTETGIGVWRDGTTIHMTQVFRRPP